MVVKIKGVIGLDITAAMVEYQLNRESGDLLVELDSPGGLVSESVSIFNSIAGYTKGAKTIDIKGEASSGASYIMFSGDKIRLAHNSSVFIHPPQGCACGNYHEMYSYGSYLEDLTKMFIKEYARYMKIGEDEAKDIVEEGRWFIGEEKLSLLGEVYDAKEKHVLDENTMMRRTLESMSRMNSRLTQEFLEKDIKQCAQMFKRGQGIDYKSQMNTNNVIKRVQKTEVKMNKEEFKSQHPDLFQAVMQEGYEKGYTEGKEKEHKRVKAHMGMLTFAPDIAKEAIESGISFYDEEMQSKYMQARFSAQMILDMENDNPPPVNPGEIVVPQAPTTPEQQKQEAEMKERNAVREALAGFGKKFKEAE